MTFYEFLDGMGEPGLREYLENLDQIEPLPEAFHLELIDLLSQYYFCGGMPEAVLSMAEGNSLEEVRTIHQEIITSYTLDFAKHAKPTDIPKLSHIWDSIVEQLARENKKFMFSAIRKSARARDYENAIIWLEDAGLILRAFCVNTPKRPLSTSLQRNIFKVYALDVGILGAMAGIDAEMLVSGDRIFNEFTGVFTENYAAQQLRAVLGPNLQYWKDKNGKAEIDFLFETAGEIFPLEVKAGINLKSKSLHFFASKYNRSQLFRTSLRNLRRDGKICNIPLYYRTLCRVSLPNPDCVRLSNLNDLSQNSQSTDRGQAIKNDLSLCLCERLCCEVLPIRSWFQFDLIEKKYNNIRMKSKLIIVAL